MNVRVGRSAKAKPIKQWAIPGKIQGGEVKRGHTFLKKSLEFLVLPL